MQEEMQELPSSTFPCNIIKNDETLISMCAVKQENGSTEETCHHASPTFSSTVKRPLIDSPHEMTMPQIKRIKLESDYPSFLEDNESILLSSKTSLQTIVSEVAHSFKNNNYENVPSFQMNNKPCFDRANRTLSAQADTVAFSERKERQSNGSPHIPVDVNEVKTRHENLEALPPSVDKRKGEISVLSSADQARAATTKPILRTIKSQDSGASEGFAYDHNFFPKLVGVHSISSPTPTSPEVESHRDFPQTANSPPALEKLCQNQSIEFVNVEEASDVYEVDPSSSSPTDQIPRNSPIQFPTNFQSEKQYDLLFTFTQDDGKSDMFLVIKDEVFAVRRFDHKGESYLIHTDNKGKTSILAKAPREEKTESQNYGGRTGSATGHRVLNKRTETTNVSSIASKQSTHPTHRRSTSNSSAKPQISSTTVQNNFVRTFKVNARDNSGQRQTAYDDMRMPRRQQSNQTNGLGAESSGQGQRPVVPAGQQRFPSPVLADRHQVVTRGSLQNSQAPRVASTSSNIMSNQQFVVNQGLVDMNQPRNIAMNAISQQQNTNTRAQIPYSENNTVISGRQSYLSKQTTDVDNYRRPEVPGLAIGRSGLATNDNRIAQRRELMKYITHQLASSKTPVLTTRNSTELINLVNRKPQASGRQTNVTNEMLNRTASFSTCQEMTVPHRQLKNTDTSLAPRDAHAEGHKSTIGRGVSSEGNSFGIHDVGQRYHPNQRVAQNSGVVHSQTYSDATQHNVNPLQEGVQSNGEAGGSDEVLQIIESWKRHQQAVSSNDTHFRQLRELLTRVESSTNSAQNPHSSSREKMTTNHSQVAQPSTMASANPVISQISYGVISRSTDGENVSPKRTATAIVIDQQRSIYIDATDSVIDEGSRSGNAGQQFSNSGNTVSGLNSNQSGNVVGSFPVSPQATVNGWLQETGRPVNSNITYGQQVTFCSGVPQNLAPVSPSYPSFGTGLSDHRFYSYQLQPRKTVPKVDKRCVANNTLNPFNTPIGHIQMRPPLKRRFMSTFLSGQQSGLKEAQDRGNSEIDKLSEIAKLCEVTIPIEVARLCEATKPCEVAKPYEVARTCALDKSKKDDVIEIIDSPPTRDSTPDSSLGTENNEIDKNVTGQQSCINEGQLKSSTEVAKSRHPDKHETDDVVEIMKPSLKRDSVDHENDHKDNFNRQLEEDAEQIRINELKTELIKKIQNTNERIAEEKIDWKKKYLNRLKIALTKRLAKIPGVTDVTVVDDD